MSNIPLVDLGAQYASIKDEIAEAIESVFSSTQFIQGKFVKSFEKEFSIAQGVACAVGCANGTTAISLALRALGIGVGDEVITTPHTFIGTVEPILEVGAHPVFVDIDPKTYNIDTSLISNAITEKTRAIIPVHLYGNPVNMTEVVEIAVKNNLHILEDCAQAHLATHKNKFVGTFGEFGTFSFYPGKNLGAYGDAGIVISNDTHLAELCRKLVNHGRSSKYLHDIAGYNYRMDDIQAAFLSVKLKYLNEWTERRRHIANLYTQLLCDHPSIVTPTVTPDSKHVYHIYAVQLVNKNRDAVLQSLHAQGIKAGIHYPVPIYRQPALQKFEYQVNQFPVTETISSNIISLPIYPELSDEKVEWICDVLLSSLKQSKLSNLSEITV